VNNHQISATIPARLPHADISKFEQISNLRPEERITVMFPVKKCHAVL